MKRNVEAKLIFVVFKPVLGMIPLLYVFPTEKRKSAFSVEEATAILVVFNTPASINLFKLSLPRATQGVLERFPVTGSTGLSY